MKLITGGCGFIGTNVALYYSKQGEDVLIVDNLSRKGSDVNLRILQKCKNIIFIKGDIRDFSLLTRIFLEYQISVIFHFAAQVAVTTSVNNPREDFEINALGTFNILEAVRNSNNDSVVVYASTNKVYGGMSEVRISNKNERYYYEDFTDGIHESQLLDFHSPYGCSKGAADQYVRDYSRIYEIKTITFRQSCIYGYNQFGVEDQGWIAWFLIASLLGKEFTIYGNGQQVRDVLFVDDLVNAFDLALNEIENISGQIYNVGGGPQNTLSLLELIDHIEKLTTIRPKYTFSDWRLGDQPVYISDVSKAKNAFGWTPTITPSNGIQKLYAWLSDLIKDKSMLAFLNSI